MSSSPDLIILGAGPSGIALAHTLKHRLGFQDFTIYEKLNGPGGTWRSNTYPGVGCDVPTILYSFSFNLNPNWSKELCEGSEILQYLEDTVDKFDLRKHMQFRVECVSAAWNEAARRWNVTFKDLQTGISYIRSADILISAVGGIAKPRDIRFPVIGNGCSAAQVVPSILKKAAYVKQYARSAQWYHERPNRDFTSWEKWCLKYVPLWERYLRLRLFLANDSLVATYMSGPKAEKLRNSVEAHARQYIRSTAPVQYHKDLIPDFPLGCKRRIFDPEYLKSLHNPQVQVVAQGIKNFDETGIVSTDGVKTEFDIVVLATGFQVQQFLTPINVIGKAGRTLNEQWEESRGAQAYMGSYVHNFPNFAILFGPNTFPAHNSVLFSTETQIQYIARTLISPILDHRASVIEVKATAENQWVNKVHSDLRGSVFQAGCSNWYINDQGRNSASWPGYAASFWKETMIPRRGVFVRLQGSRLWFFNTLLRWAKTTNVSSYTLIAICFGFMAWKNTVASRHVTQSLLSAVSSGITSLFT